MRVGILGGTFDPIHFGHLRAAEEVREALGLDKVWIIPAGVPPHKQAPDVTPFRFRLEMARLATAGHEAFEVLDMEGERPGPSYTVETLRELAGREGEDFKPFFILGKDAFLDIGTWKDFESLPHLSSLVVMARGQDGWEGARSLVSKRFPEHVPEGPDTYVAPGGGAIHLVRVTNLEISSSDIRRRVKEGRSARFLAPGPVIRYMEQKGLYREKAPAGDDIRAAAPFDLPARILREVRAGKGEEPVLIDVRGRSDFTDFLVIVHGASARQVRGIADSVEESLAREGMRPRSIEGLDEGKWVLIDYGDVIVHIFQEPVRRFYDLEGLWRPA